MKIKLAGCTVDRIAMRFGKKGKISDLVSGQIRIDLTPTQERSLPAGGPQVGGHLTCHQTDSCRQVVQVSGRNLGSAQECEEPGGRDGEGIPDRVPTGRHDTLGPGVTLARPGREHVATMDPKSQCGFSVASPAQPPSHHLPP